MAKPPLALIHNPASGRGTSTRRLAEAERLLRHAGFEWTSLTSSRSGEAIQLSRQAALAGAEVVVACGGDGTVSQVAQGLLGTGASLGVLPLGTGNDFARHLGLQRLESAVDALSRNEHRRIDAVAWRTDADSGHLINVGGCGFDAVVAERVNRGFRGLRGTSAYVAAVMATLASYQATEIHLEVDGASFSVRAMLCAIANASSYGGGMRIAPTADLADGWLDCIVIGEVSRMEFLRTFPRVFRGDHLTHPAVTALRGKRIRIDAARSLPLLCDGELTGSTPVVFEVEPSALSVVC